MRHDHRIGAAVTLALLAATVAPAAAQNAESQYSSTAVKTCKTVEKAKGGEGDWSVMSCPSHAGYAVRVSDFDLRTTVSVGRTIAKAAKEPAAEQTFPPFNSVGDALEWRGPKGGAPYALIHRWMLADSQDPEPNGQPKDFGLLVVTRLPPGPVCHVAYVDVRANPDANALARQAADEFARGFKCGADKVHVIGKRDHAMKLAMPE